MAGKYILVLDAGTSGIRCHVCEPPSRIVFSSTGSWAYKTPEQDSPLLKEFEPEATWNTIRQLVGRSIQESNVPPQEIAAISVTSQRQGFAFLDQSERELYVGPNVDLRAVFEGGEIDEGLGEEVYHKTGHFPSFLFAPAKLRWFMEHRPLVYSKIDKVCTLGDWLSWKLSGTLVSETTLAGEAGLLDIRERKWCHSLLEELGVSSGLLPPLVSPGEMPTPLSRQLTLDWGLKQDTSVVIAGADMQCGLLGLGALTDGDVGIVAGWSLPVQMVTATPFFSNIHRTWVGNHVLPDKWVSESSAGNIGESYRWLKDLLFADRVDAYQYMDSLAQGIPTGSEGASVFFGPPVLDMRKLGLASGGLVFPTPLSFTAPENGHLIRAALESYAYSAKASLERLKEVTGENARSIRIGGGMTLTNSFTNILADVLGRQVIVSQVPQVSALGAALCGVACIGNCSVSGQGGKWSHLRTIDPDPIRSSEYHDLYEQWLLKSNALAEMGL